MNAREVIECMEFLRTAKVGDRAENEGRTVEVVDMEGGIFLLTDEHGDVAGLSNSEYRAVQFLKSGRYSRIQK